MDYLGMAQQLRATRQAEQQKNDQQVQSGGAAMTNGGIVGQGNTMFQSGGYAPQTQQQQPQTNPLQTGLDAYNKYKMASTATPGAFAGATPATMSAMEAGGGSSLGSMGLMSNAPAVSYPGASAAGGSATGAGTGGTAASGAMGTAGGLAGLAALGYLTDKEMNGSKGSFINTDKLNNSGTIGGSGIGLRFGDLVNGFNPATWLRNPKQGAKGLGNFFTLGFLDKII